MHKDDKVHKIKGVTKEDKYSDLRELLKRSLEISIRIEAQNQKLLKKFRWMQIASYIRLALIAIPFILALIYLPPLIAHVLDQYNQISSQSSVFPNLSNVFDILK
ncbi:MAG: hypothetical protein CO137_01475 [Candidatus Magasanikbacteria bacterium CG_4_9_14_3_um_filter_32_9]|uniref:Uncharacterized protein n=1 Tax=Candidatus Magasanikbacteria bacterium CG_4_9_14_3_um_filter_32_9 TaxID=1974644 RepID=A0A2M7Z763_9BACT|nr:MAG: hypothetical protein CO137_01475 [Candidatus Magasanikbacteria bacterium CG_4_9_14_3_um_filter_32_9]